jgi:hypothetical protein
LAEALPIATAEIIALERQVRARQDSLVHVDATLKLLDSDSDVGTVKPKPLSTQRKTCTEPHRQNSVRFSRQRAHFQNPNSPRKVSVRLVSSFPFEGIGKALHAYFGDIAKEPLPERWVDLINYLNEKEQAQRRAQHWLNRAEDARLQAAHMTDPQAKHQMLMIAAEYQRLAKHAEKWAASKKARTSSS